MDVPGYLELRESKKKKARQLLNAYIVDRLRDSRPGLTRVVHDLPDNHSSLLIHFPPDRILERLARLNEAGKARVHALRPGLLTSEEDLVARVGNYGLGGSQNASVSTVFSDPWKHQVAEEEDLP